MIHTGGYAASASREVIVVHMDKDRPLFALNSLSSPPRFSSSNRLIAAVPIFVACVPNVGFTRLGFRALITLLQ